MLLLIMAACGAPDPVATKPVTPTEMASSSPGMAMPADEAMGSDKMFIDMMVPHHQGAVEMATIARARGDHAEIKAMAEGIITSQSAEIVKLKSWRKAWFGSDGTPAMGIPMSRMDMPGMAAISGMAAMPGMSSMKNMVRDIEALKTAVPFDLAFLDAMIPHHEGAVMMAQACIGKPQHDEVKALATDILRDQNKEIVQMREWRQAWYPAAPAIAAH